MTIMKMYSIPRFYFVPIRLVGLLAFLGSCVGGTNPVECTLIEIYATIRLQDVSGHPISGLQLEHLNVRTQKPLCYNPADHSIFSGCQETLSELEPGRYVVYGTRNTSPLELGEVKNGDLIRISGVYNGKPFQLDLKAELDRSGCHPKEDTEHQFVLD